MIPTLVSNDVLTDVAEFAGTTADGTHVVAHVW